MQPLTLRVPHGPGEVVFDRWFGLGHLHDEGGTAMATLKTSYPVRLAFQNLEGPVGSKQRTSVR